MTSQSKRLSYLHRKLDNTIEFARYRLFMPLALAVVVSGSLFAVARLSFPLNPPFWIITLLALALLIGWFLVKGEELYRQTSEITYGLKRKIYRALRGQILLGGARKATSLARHVISEHFVFLRPDRYDQREIVSKIVNTLRTDENQDIFFIEAESGLGKTATSFLLIDRLLTDPSLSPLVDKVMYFDLAANPNAAKDLVNFCSASSDNNAFIIVDNFHRVPPHGLKELTNTLVDRIHGRAWRLVLLLTQPKDFITSGPAMDVAAMDAVIRRGTYYYLSRHTSNEIHQVFTPSRDTLQEWNSIEKILDGFSLDDDDPLRWVIHANMNRLATLGRPLRLDFASRLFSLSSGEAGLSVSNEYPGKQGEEKLLKVVAAITALSIHRGVFSRKDISDALAKIASARVRWLSPRWWALLRVFRKFHRQGFVIEAVTSSRFFVFHETMARHFKDSFFFSSTVFRHGFENTCELLSGRSWYDENPLMHWLYAVERGDNLKATSSFAKAMCSGAFSLMLGVLDRNIPAFSEHEGGKFLNEEIEYERGVLLERVGRFEEARSQLRRVVSNIDPTGLKSDFEAWVSINSVESDHGPDAITIMEGIVESKNVSDLAKCCARYWLIHMGAHRGTFDESGLDEILDYLTKNGTRFEKLSPYAFLHLARRAYFDRIRFFYLTGSGDLATLRHLDNHPIARLLRSKLAEFDAFHTKFISAHCLHYEALFSLGIFGYMPDGLSTVFRETEPFPQRINDFVPLVKAAYDKAIEQFNIFGDKTAKYIVARQIEVELATLPPDDVSMLGKLLKYKDFIDSTRLLDLAPYPHIYFFKYHYRRSLDSLHGAVCDANTVKSINEHDHHEKLAKQALTEALAGFQREKNEFGIATCKLFEAVLEMGHQGDMSLVSDALWEQRKNCLGHGYKRHVRILDHLLSCNALTRAEMGRIVSFFPFVHQ